MIVFIDDDRYSFQSMNLTALDGYYSNLIDEDDDVVKESMSNNPSASDSIKFTANILEIFGIFDGVNDRVFVQPSE